MSGHKYISNSNNLFAEDDDVDDETFLRNARPKPSPSYGGRTLSDIEQQRQTMLERQRDIEQRTLDSTTRSIGLLRDSEQIGVSTAEELLRQREQLESTSKRLDEINSNLRFSQKHINGIKSVFSSLKNYISGRNEQNLPSKGGSTSSEGIENSSNGPLSEYSKQKTGDELFNSHPSTRLKGFNEEPDRTTKYTGQSSESRRINELLDANLDEMADTISRLKNLGTQLGEEIDSQSDLIGDIHDKVETADMTIGRQTKQMNKILGK